MKQLGFLLVLLVAGCSGDTPKMPDGPTAGAFGATCTVPVDTGSTECMSGVCTSSFDMLGHDVCSVKCTPGMDSTCPSGSTGMKCNMKGYCKP